ncbi:TRADD-N-associated membrane domain-containing protein [Agrobacterium deltaense]|uniref:TRADD-N-associated membrane domain-containing protein n=1 Tax=Agrobacterium deltaense TaxID=1183412 RepID=UPI000F63F258|nr:hypothetical protein [Agrobacterium deltaense]RRN71497.1 hypothetical protein EIQ31_13380 [Agrobacterium deltaense]
MEAIFHAVEVFAEITAALLDAFRKHKVLRGLTLTASVIILAFAGFVALLVRAGPIDFLGRSFTQEDLAPFIVIPTIFCLAAILLALASFGAPLDIASVRSRESDADKSVGMLIEALGATISGIKVVRKKAPFDDAKKDEPEDIIDAIKGNLGQVLQYYVMNIGQARNSFRASLTAVIVGFVTIIVGVWWAYANNMSNNSAYIVAIAGVVLQFIGGGYFYLYNRSLIQLNFFFGRLALMQDTLLAIRLADSIPEGADRNAVLQRLIFTIAERGTTAPAYLSEPQKPKPASRRQKVKPENLNE